VTEITIGIDFDNTIVCYDEVFRNSAIDKKMVKQDFPIKSKEKIRDYLHKSGKKDQWILLQGYVYGACIDAAQPFPRVIDFFRYCNEKDIKTVIISHKTVFPVYGPKYNLHNAARKWLKNYQLDQIVENIFFESTKKNKMNRIREVNCTHFIDDLPEFLAEKDFPAVVERIHFDPNYSQFNHKFRRLHSWQEIIDWIKKQ